MKGLLGSTLQARTFSLLLSHLEAGKKLRLLIYSNLNTARSRRFIGLLPDGKGHAENRAFNSEVLIQMGDWNSEDCYLN